jgi:hypothetical protein
MDNLSSHSVPLLDLQRNVKLDPTIYAYIVNLLQREIKT